MKVSRTSAGWVDASRQAVTPVPIAIAANDGVFTRSQAIDHGHTDKALRIGIDHGLWQHYGAAGICLADGFQDTDRSRLRMHLIRAGSRAIVTGPSGLQIFGIDLAHTPRILFSIGAGQSYLSRPRDHHLQLPGAVLLRDRTRPHVTWIDGLPLATRTRAIVDALRVVERHQALTVLHRCLQRPWVSPDELELATTRLHRHRGLTQLRAMAKEAAASSHAEFEPVTVSWHPAHSRRRFGHVSQSPTRQPHKLRGFRRPPPGLKS